MAKYKAGCIHCGQTKGRTLLEVRKEGGLIIETRTVCRDCLERYRCTECGKIEGTTQQYLFGYRFCERCRPKFPKPKIKEDTGIPLALKKLFAETLIAWLKEGMLREEVLHLDTGYIRLPAVKTLENAAKALAHWWGYSKELPKSYKEQVQGLIKRLSTIITDEIVRLYRPFRPKWVRWLNGKSREYPTEIVEKTWPINKEWNTVYTSWTGSV